MQVSLDEVRRQVKLASDDVSKDINNDWSGWSGDGYVQHKGANRLKAEMLKRLDKMEDEK